MKINSHKKIILAAVILLVAAVVFVLVIRAHTAQNMPPPPLVVTTGGPIGLIGTITAIGTSTITIEGQPPGNTSPIILQLSVDSNTTLTKLSATYATSSIALGDLSVGMRVNVAADAPDQNGVRPAERIIVIPSATSTIAQ